jgi:hypothetical protein
MAVSLLKEIVTMYRAGVRGLQTIALVCAGAVLANCASSGNPYLTGLAPAAAGLANVPTSRALARRPNATQTLTQYASSGAFAASANTTKYLNIANWSVFEGNQNGNTYVVLAGTNASGLIVWEADLGRSPQYGWTTLRTNTGTSLVAYPAGKGTSTLSKNNLSIDMVYAAAMQLDMAPMFAGGGGAPPRGGGPLPALKAAGKRARAEAPASKNDFWSGTMTAATGIAGLGSAVAAAADAAMLSLTLATFAGQGAVGIGLVQAGIIDSDQAQLFVAGGPMLGLLILASDVEYNGYINGTSVLPITYYDEITVTARADQDDGDDTPPANGATLPPVGPGGTTNPGGVSLGDGTCSVNVSTEELNCLQKI